MNNKTRKQQVYTPEFRGSAVKLAIDSDQSVSQTAKEQKYAAYLDKKIYTSRKEKSVKTRTDEHKESRGSVTC